MMSPSGIDHFARLITNLQRSKSQGLEELAAALVTLPPASQQRVAYNSVMDHPTVPGLGPAIEDLERDHIEDYRLGSPGTRGPAVFLENLILDIDSLIEDAEVSASNETGDDLAEEADDLLNGKANKIAREIANGKAEEGAREAAEEAYKLAYEWAYEDIFEKAYRQALIQLSTSDVQA
jgi:hypothetical protein